MDIKVQEAQAWLNDQYGTHSQWRPVTEDGFTGWGTIFGLIRGLQIELGITTLADNFGSGTATRFTTQVGVINASTQNANLIHLLQASLWCKGYAGGFTWGTWDSVVSASVNMVRSDMGLSAIADVPVKVLKSLMSMDAYTTLPGGTQAKRAVQQWLNGKYNHRRDFSLLPCDGLFSRNTQQGLMYAIQYQLNMADGVANGNFGPGTKSGLREQGGVGHGSQDFEKSWVRLYQAALIFNDYETSFNGVFDDECVAATEAFQQYAELPVHGAGDYVTWASLLVSTGDENRPAIASDMGSPLTAADEYVDDRAAALYASGIRTVGRYLTVATKRYQPGELKRIFDAGLRTFPIMQEENTELSHFTEGIGRDHAFKAQRRLRQLGFRSGTTVFFSVDYDATDEVVTSHIIPFFQAIHDAMSHYSVAYSIGVYGTRNVCARVIDAGLASEAFIASMAWGWSGNLGYPLPPSWSYDQIKNGNLPGTSLEIDWNVQSVRANPVARIDMDATPHTSEAFDSFYWMITHLVTLAEQFLQTSGITDWDNRLTATMALWYIQTKDSDYLDLQFQLYPVPPTNPSHLVAYQNFPSHASTLESVYDETQFIEFITVVDGIPAGTSHLAVTARGYQIWGRPTPSDIATCTVSDLGGWALDLVTFWAGWVNDSTSWEADSVDSYIARYLGRRDSVESKQGSFSFNDLIGDIDGYLIGSRLSDAPGRRLDDVVREVRASIAQDPQWRYERFYAERFSSSYELAKAAAKDVFKTGNIVIDSAVKVTVEGIEFVVASALKPEHEYTPSVGDMERLSAGWATMVRKLAEEGPEAATFAP